MEKNEHAILSDVPPGGSKGIFHSSIMTTYSIDLIHFDNQLLNMLHRKQICSVNIFADKRQMEKSMDFASPVYINGLGREYSITQVSGRGAFHPKINFFVGDEAVLVVCGSGNLTVLGQGKNHEAFTGFMIDGSDDAHRPLIEECWRYICQFTNYCNELECNRILKEVPENCRYLDPAFKIIPHSVHEVQEGMYAALLYNDLHSGILQQLTTLIPLEEVVEVTVVSPFFDENGETLIALSSLCRNSTVNVLMQMGCHLPPIGMPENERIRFYDFDETKRGKHSFKTYDRQLHAKLLHFKTDDAEYCMVGSANATVPGLGTMYNRGINEEFCVLYYSKTQDFLSFMGLKAGKRISLPNIGDRYRNEKPAEEKFKLSILSVQYVSQRLRIRCNEELSEKSLITVDNGIEIFSMEPGYIGEKEYDLNVRLGNGQYVCHITDKDQNRISNRIFISWPEVLATTNPSKINRNLNRLISHIENEGYEGLELAEMLVDVMWELDNDTPDMESAKLKIMASEKIPCGKSLPEIAYNHEYDNDTPKKSVFLSTDGSSRLIECIEESIRKKIRSLDESMIDEEEEGSPETSNIRREVERADIPFNKKHIKGCVELTKTVLNRYQKLVDRRYMQVKNKGNEVITKDDLNFFSLSIFAAMEICYLNRMSYKFDHIDIQTRSYCQKQFYDSLDNCICSGGIGAFEKLVWLCKTLKMPVSMDQEHYKVVNRAMKYAILFGILFKRLSHIKTVQVWERRLMNSIRSLVSLFGLPSVDILTKELEPLAKRYGYIFRMNHVENLWRNISL